MSKADRLPFYPLTSIESQRIDAVRGFFCLYVFCFHFYNGHVENMIGSSSFTRVLFDQGYIVFEIFFALSGFLIFYSVSKMDQAQAPSYLWPRYFIRRVFRIFPSWIVILTLTTLLTKKFEVGDYLWNLFFIFGLKPFTLDQLTVMQSWSLYVEEIFYLLFPIFIFFFRRQLTLPLIVIFSLGMAIFPILVFTPEGFSYYTPFNTFSCFAYGMLAYACLPYMQKMKVSSMGFYLCLVAGIFAAVSVGQKEIFVAPYVIFWFLFIFAAPQRFSVAFNFMFRRLGRICFSYYLSHRLAIMAAVGIARGFTGIHDWTSYRDLSLVFLLAAILSIAFALALYLLIERPFIHVGRTVAAKLLSNAS